MAKRRLLSYHQRKGKGWYSWRKRYSGVGISRHKPKSIHVYR